MPDKISEHAPSGDFSYIDDEGRRLAFRIQYLAGRIETLRAQGHPYGPLKAEFKEAMAQYKRLDPDEQLPLDNMDKTAF